MAGLRTSECGANVTSKTRSRSWSLAAFSAVALAIAASGCGSSDESSDTAATTPAPSSSTAPTSTAPASTPPTSTALPTTVPGTTAAPTTTVFTGGSTEPVLVPPTGCCDPGPGVLLTNVTAQHMGGFDRIIFEFTAPVMNYHVRYVPLPVKEDPSDQEVDLQGDHAIQISMGATGLDQSAYPATSTYTGPTRIAVGSGPVLELVQNGDFEAVSNWVLGVRGQPAFRVSTGSSPAQLIIDVASS